MANSVDSDQTPRSDLGLHCPSMSVRKLKIITVFDKLGFLIFLKLVHILYACMRVYTVCSGMSVLILRVNMLDFVFVFDLCELRRKYHYIFQLLYSKVKHRI